MSNISQNDPQFVKGFLGIGCELNTHALLNKCMNIFIMNLCSSKTATLYSKCPERVCSEQCVCGSGRNKPCSTQWLLVASTMLLCRRGILDASAKFLDTSVKPFGLVDGVLVASAVQDWSVSAFI